jgi:cytochrome P450
MTAAVPSPVLSEEYQTEAHKVVARLREQDPVHFVPELGFWLVTRYDDVRRLFTDPNVTNDRRAWEHHVAPPEGTFMRFVSENGLFAAPPEEHARLRRFISAGFTPRAVARQDGQVRDVVLQFAAPLRGRRGVVDLMAEFTDPIPNTVISRITGIPPRADEEVRFRELAQTTIRGFFSIGAPELQKAAEAAFLEIAERVRALAAERRREPREDLVSDLVAAVDRGERLSDDEIVMLIVALIGAGSETTAIGGAISVVTLLEHPEALARLRADRTRIPQAVNEILRYAFGGPGGLPRYALRDFELRGKTIRKGQMILLSFTGAHRDPAVFPDPDRFDTERDTRELAIFGHGPHFCIGAHLARAEMGCMIEAMLDFLPPRATLRRDLVRTTPMGIFRRPENLPVEFA